MEIGKKEFIEKEDNTKSRILMLMYIFVCTTGSVIILGVFLSLFPEDITRYFTIKGRMVLLGAFFYCLLRIIVTVRISNKIDEFLDKKVVLGKMSCIYKLVFYLNYYIHYRRKDNITSCFSILYLFLCSLIAVGVILIIDAPLLENIMHIGAFGLWLWAIFSFFWIPVF